MASLIYVIITLLKTYYCILSCHEASLESYGFNSNRRRLTSLIHLNYVIIEVHDSCKLTQIDLDIMESNNQLLAY